MRSFSSVTSLKYGIRDDRHADAGSSHVGSPARRDSSRISSFVKPGFVERTAHAELARGLAAGPVVAAIVGVAAVGDHRNPALARDRRELRVQLVLAVIAAVRGIGAVLGPLQLAGVNDLVAETELARRGAWRAGDDGRDSWDCRR